MVVTRSMAKKMGKFDFMVYFYRGTNFSKTFHYTDLRIDTNNPVTSIKKKIWKYLNRPVSDRTVQWINSHNHPFEHGTYVDLNDGYLELKVTFSDGHYIVHV